MMEKRYRLFFDFEEEERWINERAAEGLLLRAVHYPRYDFERGEPGSYIYRMQLLRQGVRRPESRRYLEFLEEMGIEYVDHVGCWIYLRRPAAEGPFELQPDLDARIAQAGRVRTILWIGMILEIVAAAAQLPFLFDWMFGSGETAWANLLVMLFGLGVAAVIGWELRRLDRKLHRMRSDRQIGES